MYSDTEHRPTTAKRQERRMKYRRKRQIRNICTLIAVISLALIFTIFVLHRSMAGSSENNSDISISTTVHKITPGRKDSAPSLSQAEQTIRAFAQQKNISFDSYPQSLVELLERNPETEEFVLNYPFRGKTTHDLSGYDRSSGVPLFMQWDSQWGYEPYGTDVLGLTGCGPTCLAMAGYYLRGDASFTPDQVAHFSESSGYYAPGQGSAWALISEGGRRLGLDVTEIPLMEQLIAENLNAGNLIICAMGPGDFTTAGHYILLTGYENGMIRLNDPNSHRNSEKLWDYKTLEPQIANLWVIR